MENEFLLQSRSTMKNTQSIDMPLADPTRHELKLFLRFLVQFFGTLTKDKMTVTHREQNYKEQKTNNLERQWWWSPRILFFSLWLTILPLPYIYILKLRPRTVPWDWIEPSDIWLTIRCIEPLRHSRLWIEIVVLMIFWSKIAPDKM